eukprot:1162015-Pelagomonas_calceolata.AAC.2
MLVTCAWRIKTQAQQGGGRKSYTNISMLSTFGDVKTCMTGSGVETRMAKRTMQEHVQLVARASSLMQYKHTHKKLKEQT